MQKNFFRKSYTVLIIFLIIVSCSSIFVNASYKPQDTNTLNDGIIHHKLLNNVSYKNNFHRSNNLHSELSMYFYKDLGIYGWGVLDASTVEYAIRITPDELVGRDGWQLTAAQFFHFSDVHPGNLKIYDAGTTSTPGTLLQSVPYTATEDGWVRVNLPTPIQLDITKDIWVSFEMALDAEEYSMMSDESPTVSGKGDWYYSSETGWIELNDLNPDYTRNWNIEAIISGNGENQNPIADFIWTPSNPVPDKNFTLDASVSSDSDGSIIWFYWDLNDDYNYELYTTIPTINHSYPEGQYPINLKVIDCNGGYGIVQKKVIVGSGLTPPIIHCPSYMGVTNIIYTFHTDAIEDPEGGQLYCLWDWGDGNTSGWLGPYASGESVNASYAWSGPKIPYNITVKIKNSTVESNWSKREAFLVFNHPTPSIVIGVMIVVPEYPDDPIISPPNFARAGIIGVYIQLEPLKIKPGIIPLIIDNTTKKGTFIPFKYFGVHIGEIGIIRINATLYQL
jgi:hypothetical protein